MNMKHVLAGTGLAILALGASAAVLAANEMQIDHRVYKTLQHIDPTNAANLSLGQKAAGMLVFPRVTKAGIGIGGEHGEGALLVGGKTMGYYSVGAASAGLTLGLAKHREVLMF